MLKKYSVLFFFLLSTSIGLGQTTPRDSTYVDELFQIGDSIEYQEPQKALRLYQSAYELSNTQGYDNRAFHAILYTALVHNNIAQYDSAFYYLERAEKLADITKSPLNKAKVDLNKANTFHLTGDANSAVDHHLNGISYLEKIGDSSRLSNAYANLAAVYAQLEYNEKEISYFKKSIEFTPNGDFNSKALTYGDIALAYLKVGEFDRAKSNLIKSDSVSVLGKKSQILPFYLDRNWGDYYRITEDHINAIEYYEKSLRTAEKINYTHFGTDVLVYLGESQWASGNIKSAEKHFLEAIKIGKEVGFVEVQQKAHRNLGDLYKEQGDITKAFDNLKLYDILKDSLNFSEHTKQINQLEIQFQTEKKDKEIAEQKLALVDQELSIQESNSKTRTMSILIVSLLLGSILLWFSFRQRQKRMQQQLIAIEREQEVRTLESLMEGEEKERLRIAKELHDGVNGDLAAIKFKLASLLETNNQVINEAVAMIDTSSEQVRAISHNLVPPSLRDFNLIEAVASYCENMNAIHEPEVSFQHLGDDIVLEKKQEANLFRIVQELVANSIKHAEAKEIHVQLSNVEDNLQLTVEDDGMGFDAENVAGDGIGMQNVRSRVDYLGGLIDIKSDTKGTSFTITITDKPEKA